MPLSLTSLLGCPWVPLSNVYQGLLVFMSPCYTLLLPISFFSHSSSQTWQHMET